MRRHNSILARALLGRRFSELTADEQRVITEIAKVRPVLKPQPSADGLSFGDRLADKVAAFGGSWSFILISVGMLALWIVLNTMLLIVPDRFDPYPFIFLNLMLSMVAALQAPIIMMSQNRQSQTDRATAAADYQINLKAENEIM